MQTDAGFWGWDIGGAHLKLAILAGDGRVLATRIWATPLWQGIKCLDPALTEALSLGPAAQAQHALTLTGELADSFSDRRQGVLALVQRWQQALGQTAWVYAHGAELWPGELAGRDPLCLASRNWSATAALCARLGASGYLIDLGSTTTDIIQMAEGKVLAAAEDDGGRLQTGELVYTGLLRTPIGALTDRAPWQGRWQGLAPELFATTADAYRLLGELDESVDLYPAADGGEKSVAGSARRLARMLGRDATEAPLSAWCALAGYFAWCQRRALTEALMLRASERPAGLAQGIVACGIGSAQVHRLARAWGLPSRDFGALCGHSPEAWPALAQVGPAYAVARLLALQHAVPVGLA